MALNGLFRVEEVLPDSVQAQKRRLELAEDLVGLDRPGLQNFAASEPLWARMERCTLRVTEAGATGYSDPIDSSLVLPSTGKISHPTNTFSNITSTNCNLQLDFSSVQLSAQRSLPTLHWSRPHSFIVWSSSLRTCSPAAAFLHFCTFASLYTIQIIPFDAND